MTYVLAEIWSPHVHVYMQQSFASSSRRLVINGPTTCTHSGSGWLPLLVWPVSGSKPSSARDSWSKASPEGSSSPVLCTLSILCT